MFFQPVDLAGGIGMVGPVFPNGELDDLHRVRALGVCYRGVRTEAVALSLALRRPVSGRVVRLVVRCGSCRGGTRRRALGERGTSSDPFGLWPAQCCRPVPSMIRLPASSRGELRSTPGTPPPPSPETTPETITPRPPTGPARSHNGAVRAGGSRQPGSCRLAERRIWCHWPNLRVGPGGMFRAAGLAAAAPAPLVEGEDDALVDAAAF